MARPGKLGVARVLEIDTLNGPRFGSMRYAEHDFLRDREVVLTFDDGPMRRNTRIVLEALAAHCTQATFFMVGQMALTDPEMVREVAAQGHTVGVHTWSHRNLRTIGLAKAKDEIELGISAVQRALGRPVAPFFRFPYLSDSTATLEHLAQRNFAVFTIDVDSKDFRTKDPEQMISTLLGALDQRRKGIVLLHDIQPSTANGIAKLLGELASRGYKVVHLVAKSSMPTQPSYDAMAATELARRNKLAAASPIAQRALVWPISRGSAPVEVYRPETGAAKATPGSRPPSPVAMPGAATRPAGGGPAPGPQPALAARPSVGGPPQQVQVPPGATPPPAEAAAPPPRPEFRGTNDEDDWRVRVFQR